MIIKILQPQAIWKKGKRDNQEDTIFPLLGSATVNDRLFIVCDGMGGHEHGEVASGTFTRGLAEFFDANVTPDAPLPDKMLAAAIEHAYQLLDKEDDGNYKKMGTTLTLIYLHRGGITAAHIGDSRIYHIRPGKEVLYVSRDHSLVFDLYQSGEISYDEMKTSRNKNIITRAVQPGEDNRARPDIIHITDIQPGDYFYLCSDGMLEQMEDDELLRLLSADESNEVKRQRLIDATDNNSDNHSAYLIQIDTVLGEQSDSMITGNEEKTARCNALNIKPAVIGGATDEGIVIVPEETAPVQAESVPPRQPVTPPEYKPSISREPAPQSDGATHSSRNPLSRLWPLLLIAFAALAAAAYFFLGNREGKSDGEKKGSDTEATVTKPEPIDAPEVSVPEEEPQRQDIQIEEESNPQEAASEQAGRVRNSNPRPSHDQQQASPQGQPQRQDEQAGGKTNIVTMGKDKLKQWRNSKNHNPNGASHGTSNVNPNGEQENGPTVNSNGSPEVKPKGNRTEPDN